MVRKFNKMNEEEPKLKIDLQQLKNSKRSISTDHNWNKVLKEHIGKVLASEIEQDKLEASNILFLGMWEIFCLKSKERREFQKVKTIPSSDFGWFVNQLETLMKYFGLSSSFEFSKVRGFNKMIEEKTIEGKYHLNLLLYLNILIFIQQ